MARHKRSTEEVLTLSDFHGRALALDERRREPRTACSKRIAILPCMDGRDWAFQSVGLLDCSPHGLSLICQEPMSPGDQFLAKLRLKNMTLVLYTVRHCTPAGDNQFKIGAEFSGIINGPDEGGPESVLNALIDAAD